MKRIKARAAIALVLAGAIVLGMGFFLYRLYTRGGSWAAYRANTHIYQDGTLKNAAITDRNGVELLRSETGSYRYAADATVRRATLHALGDHWGYLGSGALDFCADRLAGYSFVYGTPDEGPSVALTLDSRLQKTAWEALSGRAGAVMVMNYETGEILCMVSSPSYDPESGPTQDVDGVFINRCTGAAYVPGSVFKLVTLIAARENIPDLEDRRFTCTGALSVGPDSVTCTGRHGEQTIEQALAHSCNAAFGRLSLELGSETLARTAARLGITGSLKFYDTATAAGRFDAAPAGSALEAWAGIGQYNDLVTPYAMARLCAGIAGGGRVKEPVLITGQKAAVTELMSADTAEFVGDCMNYVMVYGYPGTFPALDLCAKTGTAEVGDGTSHSWFAGYLRSGAPLAFAVIVEHGGQGISAAGNVANTVLLKAVEYNQ